MMTAEWHMWHVASEMAWHTAQHVLQQHSAIRVSTMQHVFFGTQYFWNIHTHTEQCELDSLLVSETH